MPSGMRVSGLAGLAFAAVLVAGFVMDGVIAVTTGGPPELYSATISADLVRSGSSVAWPIELWIYILAALPFAIFLPGLRSALSGRDAVSAQLGEIGAICAAFFILFHTLHNLAYAAIVTGLAPSYAAGTASAVATERAAQGLIAFAEGSFLPGGGIGGALLAAALFAFGTAQQRAGSRGVGRLAIVAAALSALGYIGVFVGQAALPIALAGWVAFITWSALTSLALLHEPAGAVSREVRTAPAV